MKEIPLSNGGAAIVDDEWFPVLIGYAWHRTRKGYAQRSVRPGHGIMMHRVINMTPANLQVDHINRNKLDNRAQNLRACTNAENCRNRVHQNVNGNPRGVRSTRSGNYYAQVSKNYQRVYLGTFESQAQAAYVADIAMSELYGEFAPPVQPFEGACVMVKKRGAKAIKTVINDVRAYVAEKLRAAFAGDD